MKYLDVSEEDAKAFLKASGFAKPEEKIEEQAAPIVEETQEEEGKADEKEAVVEESTEEDIHVCPLCESQLEEELSEAKLQECIDFILDTINEASEEDGEAIEESEDEEADESKEG